MKKKKNRKSSTNLGWNVLYLYLSGIKINWRGKLSNVVQSKRGEEIGSTKSLITLELLD